MEHDTLQSLLSTRFAAAIAEVAKRSPDQVDPAIRPAGDPKFGDYQCNAALALARSLKAKPRDVAARIKAGVEPGLSEIVEPLEVAGAGFINIRLRGEFLAQYLGEIPPLPSAPGAAATGQDVASASAAADGRRSMAEEPYSTAQRAVAPGGFPVDRVGLQPVERPQRVVVEYSQPNIAKQMHVGHLRSTIIGDVFARVLAFEGHEVIRQNHVGDWGTSLGAVITGLWYLRARKRRGETAEDIRRRQAELAALQGQPTEVRQEWLRPLCSEWTKDLEIEDLDEPKDDDFDIDDLETAYIFVQTLVGVAQGTGATVRYERRGEEHVNELVNIPRRVTAMMQQGNVEINRPEERAFQRAREISLKYCQDIYDRLGVLLKPEDVRGESYYHPALAPLVAELRKKFPPRNPANMLGRRWPEVREDQGAVCAFLWDDKGQPQFKTTEGRPLPLIIQKTPEKSLADDQGAFLYATTDLAAIRFRLKELPFRSGVGAQRVIYVTDARQRLHFEMFFAAARAFGWIGDDVQVEHVTFGSVLGPDRKPLKTREGKNIKLRELLDEAEKRAYALLENRDESAEARRQEGEDVAAVPFSAAEKRAIAQRVGIAAVKYADLCRDRNADYVFNWDTMLAMQGNTAPYMMYAYARIRSIYRKAAERFGSPDVYAPAVRVAITHPTERALALRLARLREAIDEVASSLTPHTLCTYLYELAAEFMRFYESCPVLAAEDDATRLGRMRLCDLTARTLKLGLGLLGIEVIERM